ncbi:MAG: JAB domain-containing protein [Gammaproteobacteria bacterium]
MSAALKCIEDRDEDERLIARALEILARRHARGEALTSPAATQAFLRLRLAARHFETFGIIFLDSKHRVLAIEDLFEGTIDGASVYPRVVVQRALEHNAAALIAYHCHPSGDPTPSRADEVLTHRLKDALALLDIRLLDHFVVSAEGSVSMAERGLL